MQLAIVVANSHFFRALFASVLSTVSVVVAADANAEAHSVRGRSLSVGIMLGVRSVRDDTLVPIASTGPALTLSARFLGTAGAGVVDAELRLGGGPVFDRETRPGIALAHGMRLTYLPIVFVSQESWSFAVGPAVAWETDVFWLAKWDDAHAYWLGRRWLGPGVRAWRLLAPGTRLDIAAEMSLLGFESRPPPYRHNKQDALTHLDFYFAGTNRDAAFGWLADFQAVRLAFDVHRFDRAATIPNGWGLGLEARVAHSRRPEHAFVIETSIRVERAWDVP
jgi:hypothetical protein